MMVHKTRMYLRKKSDLRIRKKHEVKKKIKNQSSNFGTRKCVKKEMFSYIARKMNLTRMICQEEFIQLEDIQKW